MRANRDETRCALRDRSTRAVPSSMIGAKARCSAAISGNRSSGLRESSAQPRPRHANQVQAQPLERLKRSRLNRLECLRHVPRPRKEDAPRDNDKGRTPSRTRPSQGSLSWRLTCSGATYAAKPALARRSRPRSRDHRARAHRSLREASSAARMRPSLHPVPVDGGPPVSERVEVVGLIEDTELTHRVGVARVRCRRRRRAVIRTA